MPRPVSIRASLLRDVAVLVVALGLAVFVATFIGARWLVRSLSEALVARSMETVEVRLDAFFGEVRRQFAVVEGQAEAGAFDGPGAEHEPGDAETRFRAERDRRNRLLAPLIEAAPQISSFMLADTTGREHMLLLDGDRWRNRCVAADVSGEARWLEWTDGAAPVERREPLGYDPRKRPWFIGALATGPDDVHWTEPYVFFTTGEPGITISSRYDGDDGVERVLGLDVLLRDVSEFTRTLAVGRRGIAAVMTDDRRLIGLPGLPMFDDPAARRDAMLRHPVDLDLALIHDAHDARVRRRDGDLETRRFTSGGEAWWAGARPFALEGGRGLRVVVLVPESDLLGNLALLRTAIVGAVLLVLAIGLLRARIVARRFGAPIEALVEQSRRITRGDLEPGPPIESPIREIRRLVEAQDHMREGIEARLRLEKVERDLDIARQIQRGLLPPAPPEIDGFDIAGWNLPADETGGDFYDWLTVPDGRLAFTLADATGHGIGPALIVAVYRAYLRASTTSAVEPLGTALSHVNDLLQADLPSDRFVTSVVGVIDPVTRRGQLLSAGHGPLLYCEAATGAVRRWGADDVPLGIVPGRRYGPAREIDFAPGDVLMLITDGFFEWTDGTGEQFGIARVEAFLAAHRDRPAQTIIDELYRAVLEHAGDTEQADDLTAVVIRRTG